MIYKAQEFVILFGIDIFEVVRVDVGLENAVDLAVSLKKNV